MSENEHQRHLGRGFNWLGGAAIVAKVTDFATIVAVLVFLTKTQVGIGSLVLAVGMVVEAFDGLGTGDALVQAKAVSREALSSLFWFILVLAVIVGGAAVALSPAIGWLYGVSGVKLYFLALAAKQPLVGAAVIPLALLNRALAYEKIAMVNVGATFGAALVRFGIAVAGGGAWALVGGYFASGVFILAGALLANRFVPRWHFAFAEIRALVDFGWRSASANIFEQIFKNIDFLLVGWFYGPAMLAVYRVAFDVAMEPAMAVGTIVNRAAQPVFAKVAAAPAELRAALLWSLQRLASLVAPCMAGLGLMAVPLMGLLHDSQGHSYADAARPLKILAAAAVLRIASQLITPLLLGTGQPGKAARLSFATLLMLGGFILTAGIVVHGEAGLLAVSAAWLAVYPFLLSWSVGYLRREWDISALALAKPFLRPALAVVGMVGLCLAARALPYGGTAAGRIAAAMVATGLGYGALAWRRTR